MNDCEAYYKRYWADPGAAPPLDDPTTPRRKELLRKALADLPSGSKILDAGCGAGDFTEFAGSLGFDPVGTDLSEDAIAFARKRFPSRAFHVGTPHVLEERFQGAFAAAWSSEVIEHVHDVYGFVCSLNRLMAPEGRLILTTPYHAVLKNVIIDLLNYGKHYDPFGGHIRFFDRQSLERVLRHCGFTPIHWSGIGRRFPLYRSFFVIARKTGEPQPPPPADS